jgi:uncharacterized membrane protein YphA (DoxX/SURF4 family)
MNKKRLCFSQNKLITILANILRFGVGFLFIFSSFHKIVYPKSFLLIVENYQVVPYYLAELISAFLPWLEFIVGICLVFGFFVESSCIILSGMLLAFAYGIGINLLRDRTLACGCFGLSSTAEMITWWSFAREIILIGITMSVFLKAEHLWKINLKLVNVKENKKEQN